MGRPGVVPTRRRRVVSALPARLSDVRLAGLPSGYACHQEAIEMTAAAIEPEPVPLTRDEAGRLVVPGSRISLDILVADFKRGRTPEAIHDAYETVSLADIYAVLAYYLRHQAEVEEYLAEQDEAVAEVRARVETEFPPQGRRARLLARLHT